MVSSPPNRSRRAAKIIRYFGPLLDSKKKKDDAIENKYLFELNDRWTIDGSVRKNIARYINHACKPNAESDVKPRKRKVIIRAIKNIEPGEEINYDYGTDYFKAYLKPIGCKCAACEKKRKKQRAEARAEKARLKAKAERKALKKAEKLAKAKAEAKAKLKEKAERKAKKTLKLNGGSLNGKSLNGKSLKGKSVNVKSGAGKSRNGGHLNGNSRVRVAGKKSAAEAAGGHDASGSSRQRRSSRLSPLHSPRSHPPGLRTDFGSDESPKSTAER